MASSKSSKHWSYSVAIATPILDPILAPASSAYPVQDPNLSLSDVGPPLRSSPATSSQATAIAPVLASDADPVPPAPVWQPPSLSPSTLSAPLSFDLVNPLNCLSPFKLAPQSMVLDGKPFGQWSLDAGGAMTLRIDAPMSNVQRAELLKVVTNFVQRKLLAKPKTKSSSRTAQTRSIAQLDMFGANQAVPSGPHVSAEEQV